MDKHPAPGVREDELHALLDDRLDAADRSALRARLAHDPAASATLRDWQCQREALRQLHADVLSDPVPEGLLAAAGRAEGRQRQAQQWWRRGGMAAAVTLAFGLGWFTHGQAPSLTAPRLAQGQPERAFVHQAALAHAVYAPELRHPVEVQASQEEHLVQWLSKRLGRPLKLPRLDAQGYALVGGRLLPGEDGARAQFMYQGPRGERVTLYLGRAPEAVDGTEFRFEAQGPVPSFYWVDAGFAYALSGPLSREQLLALAQAVHHQL